METLHAVGVGALNKDILFEIPLENFSPFNKELKGERIRKIELNTQYSDKPKKIEKLKKLAEKYGRNIGESLGGSATNTMRDLSWMGFNTGYLSLVGYDYRFLREKLREEGIDSAMVFTGGLESGECISISDGRDRALRVKEQSSNDLLGLRILDKAPFVLDNLSLYKIIHMTSFACSLGYEPLEVQKRIAEELGKKVMISFSPDEFYTELGLNMLEPILKNSYVVFLSRSNMQTLTGEDYREGSRKLLNDYHIKYVFTTLGEEGAHLRYDGRDILVKFELDGDTLEIKPEGITGAGDSFVAGVLYGLLKEKIPEYCACLGIEVARMRLQGLEREAYRNIIL